MALAPDKSNARAGERVDLNLARRARAKSRERRGRADLYRSLPGAEFSRGCAAASWGLRGLFVLGPRGVWIGLDRVFYGVGGGALAVGMREGGRGGVLNCGSGNEN